MKINSFTDEMMKKRALISKGDKNRLWSVMRKAGRGETITFSVIGGSVTQGCHAEKKSESYAELVYSWWKEKFPGTPINYINAGVGATDSYIGVHRADRDLLNHHPDIVIVEFSVNDTDEVINSKSFGSLVRKILLSEKNPAVIILANVKKDGSNLQEAHSAVGIEYNLPVISLANALFPEIEKGNIIWNDLYTDEVHPSTLGHAVIGELINSYLDEVYSEANNSDICINKIHEKNDMYADAHILDNMTVIPSECSGFVKSDIFYQFPNGWTAEKSGFISFEVKCKNIGLLYYKTTDGKSGTCSVSVDGEYVSSVNGDFPGGWGNYADYSQIYVSENPKNHIIKISLEGEKSFTVLGLCIS